MPLHGLLAGILAQTCVSMLPPARAEIEWFDDGRFYALDIPLRASRTERVYRREHHDGHTTERIIACTTTDGATYFTERMGGVTLARIPVSLKPDATRTIERSRVRRISAPAGATSGLLWFAVSSPGMRLYGLQTGGGVAEIRTPAATGGFTVLRSVPRDGAAKRALVAADSQARDMERRIDALQDDVGRLHDSINALLTPRLHGIWTDVPELAVIDLYLERRAYHDALALLAHTRARVVERAESESSKQRALRELDARVRRALESCYSDRYSSRASRDGPSYATPARNVSASSPLALLLSCAARPTTLRFR